MSLHIAAKKGEIAKVVLMPGDPLRAKYIAEKYLKNVKLINSVRNIFGYTGEYKGKLVTVIASGMGISSMGIYCHELFSFYGVEKIIRIGTCGAYSKDLHLRDVIIVDKAYTDSNFAYNFNNEKIDNITSSNNIMNKLINSANNNNANVFVGNILTSEVFYRNNSLYNDYIEKGNVLGVEMESFALFYTAYVLGKEAGCILTVSDCVFENDYGILSSEEREKCLDGMIVIALDSILL